MNTALCPGRINSYMLTFVFGLSIGLIATFVSLTYTDKSNLKRIVKVDDNELTREKMTKIKPFMKSAALSDTHVHKHDEDAKSNDLKDNVRILCWVMTCPQNLDKKAIHVRKTWAHRCNVLVFVSSVTNTSFPTVGLNISEGREHLTGKTMRAFRYVYDHYFGQADWFMKADDDTFVIMENLRYFLSNEDKNSPIYFGHHFKTLVKQGFHSGGAGYILSKEAMRRFALYSQNETLCRQDGDSEDFLFGQCMENLGVRTGNSTDAYGRSRFHCFSPETHLFGDYPGWYLEYDANGAKKGTDSISDYAISFHYVSPEQMYALEFYTYHLRPHGLHMGTENLNQKHDKAK